jgi:hypothetical protein
MPIANACPDLGAVPLAQLGEQAYDLASDLVAPLPDDHCDALHLLNVLWELPQRVTPSEDPQSTRALDEGIGKRPDRLHARKEG